MWEKPPSIELLLDKTQRLQNLYSFVDRNGVKHPFTLNGAQQQLNENRWYQTVILKARQLGCTSFWAIDFLDDCFWCENISAGIIAHRREDAENIFKNKVKLAYDNMPLWTREFNRATNDRAGELAFRNGSIYRVSTGFRSGTNQRLLISEFGKICAKSPEVAKEIVTGSLNTVGPDQIIVIESTAEGRSGYFYQYCKEAEALKMANKKLSRMQMRFVFFPWYIDPSYIERDERVIVTQETDSYLNIVEAETGYKFSQDQRRWYELKSRSMGDTMKQEFPSTPTEAFEASNEGLYYGSKIAILRREGRIRPIPYDEGSPVHVSFDLGYDDYTAIWFFQLAPGGVIQLIDYYEMSGEDAKFYVDFLKSKPYTYGTILLPHDGRRKDSATATSWEDIFNKLISANIRVIDLKETGSVVDGIQCVRSTLSRCYFDDRKCDVGVKHLETYRKEWNDKLGCFKSSAVHDESSHCADSFRYMCLALDQGMIAGTSMSKEKLMEIKSRAGFGRPSQPMGRQDHRFIGR